MYKTIITPNFINYNEKSTLIMNEIIDNVKTKVELPDDPVLWY